MQLMIISAAALVALATGCATDKAQQRAQTESMLTASGFKMVPASSPVQQQMMNTLPAGRVSAVRRMGKVYFVYPDQARNVLFVGNNNQYLQYEGLAQNAHEQMLVKYQMEAINNWVAPAGWEAAWGDWDAQ
jgi:hypothetical protein